MELEGTVCIFHNFNKIAELEIALFISIFSVNNVLHLNEYKDSLHWIKKETYNQIKTSMSSI